MVSSDDIRVATTLQLIVKNVSSAHTKYFSACQSLYQAHWFYNKVSVTTSLKLYSIFSTIFKKPSLNY